MALGQVLLYRSYLRDSLPEEEVYLAVDKDSYDKLFGRKSFQRIVEDYHLAIVVVNVPREEVCQWIS